MNVAEPQICLALALDDSVMPAPAAVRSLVHLARTLQAVPDPVIDPVFAAGLEARLLAEPTTHSTLRPRLVIAGSIPSEASPQGSSGARTKFSLTPDVSSVMQAEETAPASIFVFPRRKFVVRKLLAACIAATMLCTLPLAAAASALPGSPFYGIKRAAERAQLVFTIGPVADAFVMVAHANRRLDEADQLVAIGRTSLVPATLRYMERSLEAGTLLLLRHAPDAETLRKLARSLRHSNGRLDSLLREAPSDVSWQILAALASTSALSNDVAEALSGMPVPRAQPSNASWIAPKIGPRGIAYDSVDPVVSGSEPVRVDDEQARVAPGAPGTGPRKGEELESNGTTAPCPTTVYAGPEADKAHQACLLIAASVAADDPPSVEAP